MPAISSAPMVTESGERLGLEGSFQGTASEKREEKLCLGKGLVKKLGGSLLKTEGVVCRRSPGSTEE